MSETVIATKLNGQTFEFPFANLQEVKRIQGHEIASFEFKKTAVEEPIAEVAAEKTSKRKTNNN